MPTLQEIQQTISEQEKLLEQQKSQATAYSPQIIQTQQQLRQATPYSQVQIQSQEQQREIAKQEALKTLTQQQQGLTQYKQEYETYLKSPSGIIQYAKENPATSSVHKIYGSLGKGYAEEIIAYKYTTPYGVYIDYSPQQSAIQREARFYESLSPQGQFQYNLDLESLQQQGLKPVYSGGQLTGFEDVIAQKSIPISTLEQGYTRVIPQQVIPQQVPIPIISPETRITSQLLYSPADISRKTLAAQGLTPTKAFLSSSLWNVVSGKWFTEKIEYPMVMAMKKYKGQNLTYEKYLLEQQKWKEGFQQNLEKANPLLKIFPLASEYTIKAGELFGGKISEPFRTKTKETISTLYKFAGFSPYMATGTAGESEYIYNYAKQKWIRKQQTELITPETAKLEDYTIKFERAYANQGEKGVQDLFNKYVKIMQQQTSSVNKEIAAGNIQKLLDDLVSKKIVRFYSFNANTGELILDIQKLYPKNVPYVIEEPFKIISKAKPKPIEFDITSPVGIVKLPTETIGTSVYAGTGMYERTSPKEIQEDISFLFTGKRRGFAPYSLETLYIPSKQTNLLLPEITSLLLTPQTERTALLSMQLPTQELKQQQIQTEKLATSLLTGLMTMQIPKTQQVTKQITPQITTQIFKIPTPQRTTGEQPPYPRIPRITLSDSEKRRTQIQRPTQNIIQGFIPELRRRGKFAPISSPTSLGRALEIGKQAARRTLGASLRIKGPKGYIPLQPSKAFRMGKKTPTILVQRQMLRLSSPTEVKEILRARGLW